MNRITRAYQTQFATMFRSAGFPDPEQRAVQLIERTRRWARSRNQPVSWAFTDIYEKLATRPRFQRKPSGKLPDRFFCDSGLGGLARWLRAAGHFAEWHPWIDDDALLQAVRSDPAVLLTTDSMLMERKLLRDRILPSFWLPPTHSIERQLRLVVREFRLELRPSRCMACGGALEQVSKAEMKERIPPRTYRWIDDYFRCRQCDRLFWHGTHWFRIQRELEKVWAGAFAS